MDHGLKQIWVIILILSGICLTGKLLVYADLYSWTDENGIRNVSNISPPQDGDTIRMDEKNVQISKGQLFTVIKIFDGDTIKVLGAGLEFKVRLVGIDSPEMERKGQQGQPFSQKAKNTISQLIHKKKVRLTQYGTGGYNRILAEVFFDGRNVNIEMLRTGMAEVYQGKLASSLDATGYKRAQDIARQDRIGIWSLGDKYLST